jgi:hypothetical protein
MTVQLLPTKIRELHEQFQAQPNPAIALKVIHEYFDHFTAPEIQEDLWLLLAGCMSCDLAGIEEGRQRCDLFYFYEFTLFVLQSLEVLHKEAKVSGVMREREN